MTQQATVKTKVQVEFDIVEKVGVVSANSTGNVTLELNLISYEGKEPKYDLRRWITGKTGVVTMGRGITLTQDELKALRQTLNEYLKDGDE